MFTGFIEATAEIIDANPKKFRISRPRMFDDIRIGSSIAVSGVCLSIIACDEKSMEFSVIEETIQKSTLGTLQKGDRVNLERAMKADSRLDGHIVQGHVEGVGEVRDQSAKTRNQKPEAKDHLLVIKLPKNLIKNIVQKGSIAIDGVSLTVVKIEGDTVSVALIPLTMKETMLGNLKEGAKVNIETDIFTRMHKL